MSKTKSRDRNTEKVKERSKINTVLFDLDGTLIDTEHCAAIAVEESFKDWGIPIAASDARYITGRTWGAAFQFLFSKYSLPVSDEEAARFLIARYRKTIQEKLILVPGGADAVRALSDSGRFRLGLVSGSNREEILFALDRMNIRERFDVILGAEDYPRSKPAPDGYLKALMLLNRTAQSGLVFEDSEAGIASALAAGLKVCAITSTNHFGQDTSGAHHRIADLRGVNAEWVETTF